MTESIKINWYRPKVDKAVMSALMRKSDARAFAHVIPQLLLYAATGTLAYLAWLHLHRTNWPWALPLLLLALFVHFTHAHFFSGIAGHELCHKTPFATPFWNTFFLKLYAFISWFDPVGYRASHVRHHQATVHRDHDGEVVLPQGLDWHGVRFALTLLAFSPGRFFKDLRFWFATALGRAECDGFFPARWLDRVMTETTRREQRRWARIVLGGHLALAAVFIATGHPFLIVIFTFGCWFCPWLEFFCGGPQHAGLSPDASDFRLNTRTYTAGLIPSFVYWNMQYHCEHHMFPAVPFYRLPQLRAAIVHEMPPAPHGLWATWRELIPILQRQRREPGYVFIPPLPASQGGRVDDEQLRSEAAQG